MEREMEREMDKVMLVRTKNQLWKDLSWLMRRTYPTIVGEDPVIDAYTAPFMFMPEMPAMDGAAAADLDRSPDGLQSRRAAAHARRRAAVRRRREEDTLLTPARPVPAAAAGPVSVSVAGHRCVAASAARLVEDVAGLVRMADQLLQGAGSCEVRSVQQDAASLLSSARAAAAAVPAPAASGADIGHFRSWQSRAEELMDLRDGVSAR